MFIAAGDSQQLDMAAPAEPEPAIPASAAQQIQHLQRQLAQTATAAGVLVEHTVASESIALSVRPAVSCSGQQQKADTLAKMQQLQQQAVQYADKVKVSRLQHPYIATHVDGNALVQIFCATSWAVMI